MPHTHMSLELWAEALKTPCSRGGAGLGVLEWGGGGGGLVWCGVWSHQFGAVH